MIVIVGAGIAGSSLARLARQRDLPVTVVSSARPDSFAATAVLHRAWHRRDPAEEKLYDRTLSLYAEWGIPVRSGGWVTGYRRREVVPRFDPDWRLLDPLAPLATPDIVATARKMPGGVLLGTGRGLLADRVYWCTGATTGRGITHGVTWAHPKSSALAEPDRIRVHHYAPYKTICAGMAGSTARLGSSSAATADAARKQAVGMLALALRVGLITTDQGWRPIHGRRCHELSMPAEGIHVPVGGLHRTGYALAPALAERLAEQWAS